ncbi:Nn.00g114790.m01.CDS01 [Neocucurbitaria sp. VM-36]
MADRSLNDLNYGHPGAATYDLEYRGWNFARQYTKRQLKQVQIQENAEPLQTQTIPPSTHFPVSQTYANSTSVQKDVRGLVREYPQLAPSLEQLPALALVSAAIQTTTSTYDPLFGNLLSFGSITLEDKHEHPRRIAALPAGEAGNILCLAILTKERHGWGMDRNVWIEGPSLKDAECGYWNEEAAPIQQVCFAQSEDRSTFLAVRLPTRTILFRPVYFRDRRAAKPSPYYHLPTSVIDAHPILNVGLEQTGGAPHTDIAFNPEFQLQFGIVDQNHTWSVWNIEHGRKGDAYTMSCLVQGHINPSEDADLTGEDGWARILWVGDVNTLLVCSRRHFSIISIEGASFTYLPCPALFTKRSTEWILDVQRHPRYRKQFFILTSTRLVLATVKTVSESLDATAGEAGATVLISWRHYRGGEDFTLNFSVQMLADDETYVLLHSRLNDIVQVYTFSEHPSGSSTLISTSDPTMLDFAISGIQRYTQIHMEPMQYGESGQETHGSGLGFSYMEKGIQFHRLFSICSDLSVHELVVYAHKLGADLSHSDLTVEDFTHSLIRQSRRDASRKEVIDVDNDFIVPNGLKAVEAPKSKTMSQEPKRIQIQDRASLRDDKDYRTLYSALSQTDTSVVEVSKSVDFEAVTNQLQQILVDESSSTSLPLGTLIEFAGMKINVSDIDKASESLQRLLSSRSGEDFAEIQHIASMRLLSLTETEESTVTELYDTIIQNWIVPLPPDVPTRVRQQKERLGRRIAAEVILASTRIREVQSQEPLAELQHGPGQESSISLPVLPSKPMEGNNTNTPHWQSSQPLPTPPHSSIPSSFQPGSSPPPSPFEPLTASGPLIRLSKHLKITDSSLTPTIIPSSVTELLTHWQPGTDPRMYDWDATERALRPEDLDAPAQEQREKARKKKERKERKQQREDELMKARAGSQPMVFSRSSPGPTFGSSSQVPIQSSSQVPLSISGFKGPGGLDILAPMSQVEPGRFGGRPDKKKKKKGRVSGF